MSGSISTVKTNKQINVAAESKLKQARLPFKTTTVKRNKSETGKKRKHEDDENTSAPQPLYIDLTKADGVNFSENSDEKSNKVCIIQGEKKISDTANAVESKTDGTKTDNNCSIQKWFKPKSVEVTNSNSIMNKQNLLEGSENGADESMEDVTEIHNETLNESKNEGSVNEWENESAEKLNMSIDSNASKSEAQTPTTPSSGQILKNKLTPKQRQRREEMELKRIEKERMKQEKERKKLEEKEEKQRLKEEKEKKRLAEIEAKNEEKRQKEEERKMKEEEKRKQREEEKKQKEEEKKQKEEERRQKEEERKQKEEEKKQKEEQKRQREEHERKLKEKTAAAFTNFFLPKNKEQQKDTEGADKTVHTTFMPFEVKENMRLASIHRIVMTDDKLRSLDEALQNNCNVGKSSLYLAQLKSKSYQPGHSENTWPLNTVEDEDELMIVEDSNTDAQPVSEKPMRYRCKLLQFHDNRRPAYWGTWRKRSKVISGRTPFKTEEIFNYEIDSDEEWEDEPGESVDGSDDEKESEDDYEVDNDVFVPHGYLSDEEAQNDDVLDASPKSNKLKLNILEQQFEEEMKEKTHKLKPRVFGCIWIDNSVKRNEGENNIENLLLIFKAVYDEKRVPFVVSSRSNETTPQSTPSMKIKMTNEFPDSLLPDLVKLAHGSKKNTKFLAREFNSYVLNKEPTLNLTLSCITKKLKEISNWISNLACRLVNDEIKNQCGLSDLSHTDYTWKYITVSEEPAVEKTQKTEPEKILPAAVPLSPSVSQNQTQKMKTNVPSIAKFVKVLSAEEKQMAFNDISADKGEKQISSAVRQKNKQKIGITKFVKVLNPNDKDSKTECSKDETDLKADVIDLTDDSDVKSAEPEKKSILIESSCKSTLSNKNQKNVDGPLNKPVNTLIPRKAAKSPAINILIPRKTPSQPISSPPKSTSQLNKPIETFIPDEIKQSQDNVKSKPVNILIPRKNKDIKIGDNAAITKPVNVLIPRRASDMQNRKIENSSTKPVNILIPRRASDMKKCSENIPSLVKCDNDEKCDGSKNKSADETKDFVEDSSSSDFILRIETNETSEIK